MAFRISKLTTLLSCCFISNFVDSATYYVDSEASPGGSGSSWNAAYQRLETAFSIASTNDFVYLRGNRTYIPHTSSRDDCFLAPEGVAIYGGFTGTETSHIERPNSLSDFIDYESILSGNIGNKGTNLDNCYHVLTYTNIISMDRVVVTEGNANYEYRGPETRTELNGFGAALITNDTLSSQNVLISFSVFRDNEAFAGGALWFGSSQPNSNINNDVTVRINDCAFQGNKAFNGRFEGGYGGAIYAYNSVYLSIRSSGFSENYAAFRGGAIYQDYGGDLLCNSNCVFTLNLAEAYGAAIFSQNRYSVHGTFPFIQNTVFDDNTALVFGGATVMLNNVLGGLKDSIISKNRAVFGGGTAFFWSNLTMENNVFTNNVAMQDPDSFYEAEFLHAGIDDAVQVDLNEIMSEIWDLYQNKPEQLDIFPDAPITATQLCYVDITNNNIVQDGSSWQNAYTDLQSCLDQLSANIAGGEVWVVGAGENNPYLPTVVPALKPRNRDIDKSFLLYDNIRIYGGFIGRETLRQQRNFYGNPTYLSGDVGNNQLVNNMIIAAHNTLIDGFFLVNAGCASDADEGNVGGGIYADGVEFNVVNSIFYKLCANRNGGAIHCYGGAGISSIEPIIRNVMFVGNRAVYDGGAIYATAECNFDCKWCDFAQNSVSRRGGAVFLNYNSDVYFESSRFTNNYALDSGGCVAVQELSNATFYCGKFFNNSARWEGGCLYAGPGKDIQIHDAEHFQGFIVYGDSFESIFDGNYLVNHGYYDKGQPDVYLWPFTDFIWETVDCGGSGAKPTERPTLPPSEPVPLVCDGEARAGLYANQAVELGFNLDVDRGTVIISSCLSNFETLLELLDNNGNVIAGSIGCELLISALTAGQYVIRITSAIPISNGIYHVFVSCPGTDVPETTGTPEVIYATCEDVKSGAFNGDYIEFEFIQPVARTTTVVFSTCRSTFDTYLILREKDTGAVIHECDNCGFDFLAGDCGFCCNGEAPQASEIEQILPAGRYLVTLTSVNSAPQTGRYVVEFICLPITPEPTRPSRAPTPNTESPTPNTESPTPNTESPTSNTESPTTSITTPSPSNPGRVCCGDTVVEYYHNVDIWMRFDLDQFADVTFTTCDSSFNTSIQVYDSNRDLLLATATAGCVGVALGRALLTMPFLFPDNYYIKINSTAHVLEVDDENKFVLGIICITAPPSPTAPTLPTLTPAPTPSCGNVLQCGQVVNGTYANQPIEWEINFGIMHELVTFQSCGSNFDTRLRILDDTLTNITSGCNTLSGECVCDSCGDLQVIGDCIVPFEYPCCASVNEFEPDNAQLVYNYLSPGKYHLVLDTPAAGAVFGEYRIYLECSEEAPGRQPTPQPTPSSILRCGDSVVGGFNDEDLNLFFQLEEHWGNSRVVFHACSSNFDTLLQLWDENLFILFDEDDDGCGSGTLQSYLQQAILSPANYYLVLSVGSTGSGEPTFGNFSIDIQCIPLAPTRPPTLVPTPVDGIVCGETISGDFNAKRLEFLFDLQEPVIATFVTCGSEFDTFVQVTNGDLTIVYDECDNCGTDIDPGDCGVDDIACCNGQRPAQSELTRVMTPGRYYWTLDFGASFLPIIPVQFNVTLLCQGIPTAATTLPPTVSDLPTTDPTEPTPMPTISTQSPTPMTPYPTPRWPTPYPTTSILPTPRWPTTAPKPTPSECASRCDAFSVSAVDWYYTNANICIQYNVQRITSAGYYCYRPIRYLVLGLCDGDSVDDKSAGCNNNDLNGLLVSFNVIDGDDSDDDWDDNSSDDDDSDDSDDRHRRRRLGYSKSVFGTNSDGFYGIMVNIEIESEMTFEICLTDVFVDNVEFSNNVRFRRGYNKFTCSEEWVVGLPCIDYSKFTAGSYDDSGFNTRNKYGKYYKKRRNKRKNKDSAENDGISLIDTTELKISPIVRWEVLSCMVLFSLCFIGICVYCIVLRKKNKNKNKNLTAVKSFEHNSAEEDEDSDDSLEGNSNNIKGSKQFKRKKYENITTKSDAIEMQNISNNHEIDQERSCLVSD